MCGLVGICAADEAEVRVGLRRGLSALIHRGPDDEGEFVWRGGAVVGLGLRRLAIQDLSPLGHQPMPSQDGRFVISFNGEITNFVELRIRLEAEGYSFKSRSDTEVLITAWAHWGVRCLEQLEGMFAFAILDKKEETLTLVRDPFGIKPLFFSFDERQSLCFSSEMGSLLRMQPGRRRLNVQRAVDYLQWGLYDESDETFVLGIRQLLPGHFIQFDIASGVLSQPTSYWQPSIETIDITFAEAAKEVRGMFLESVRRNLISDVPVGVALSGGIDSSAIARAIALLQPNKPFYAFSYIAKGQPFSEIDWINRAIDGTQAEFHPIEIADSDLATDLDELVIAQGEPFGSTSAYAQWRVFKAVRNDGIVVTLDGQGADEVFAGYHGYPASRLRSLVRAGKIREASSFLTHWAEWPGRSQRAVLAGALAEASPDFLYNSIGRAFRKTSVPNLDIKTLTASGVNVIFPRRVLLPCDEGRTSYLKEELRSILRYRGLPALLRHGDRNSMSSSVESRVPFLDRKLTEFSLSLPEEFLVDAQGATKSVFRAAMRGIVPDSTLDRRDKIGFETPQKLWLDPVLHQHRSVLDTLLTSTGVFKFPRSTQSESLNNFWSEVQGNSAATWRVINFLKWIELFAIETD